MQEGAEKPWVPPTTLAARLLLLRHHLGLTMDEIAKQCEVPMATWSTWERGTIPQKLDTLVARIAVKTGVDRDWLMWGTTDLHETPSAWSAPPMTETVAA